MEEHRPQHRQAGPADESVILALMREFYEEENLVFREAIASRALKHLLPDPRIGLVHLLESKSGPAGYIVLTFGFSLEFAGRYLLVDELYLKTNMRGLGWGTHALNLAVASARQHGAASMRLEVNHANAHARPFYLKNGFVDNQRDLFTRWL